MERHQILLTKLNWDNFNKYTSAFGGYMHHCKLHHFVNIRYLSIVWKTFWSVHVWILMSKWNCTRWTNYLKHLLMHCGIFPILQTFKFLKLDNNMHQSENGKTVCWSSIKLGLEGDQQLKMLFCELHIVQSTWPNQSFCPSLVFLNQTGGR